MSDDTVSNERDPGEAAVDGVATRLGRPGLRPVLDELVRRYSAGDEPARLTPKNLSIDERSALADLLGAHRLPPADPRVGVAKLATALGCSGPGDLRDAVDRLRGPLPNRRAARAAETSQRRELWEWFAFEVSTLDQLGADVDPGRLDEWTRNVQRDGVRGSIPEHRSRLSDALAVLHSLPADGTSLAALADDVLSDPHALDAGRPVARLVLSALAALRPSGTQAVDAEQIRNLWEWAGVVPDPLSSTVLMLGVHHRMFAPETASIDLGRAEPFVLTLGQLRRWPLAALAGSATIVVVENPSLLAEAAMHLDRVTTPLVCSSGQPSVAVNTALRQLAANGARILQHADFDPAGIAICRLLAERVGAEPWMMTAPEYEAAVPTDDDDGAQFSGLVPETPWDPPLAPLMQRIRRPVYEERLRRSILEAFAALE